MNEFLKINWILPSAFIAGGILFLSERFIQNKIRVKG